MQLGDNERERLKQIRAMLIESQNSMLDDWDVVYAADVLDKACEEIDQLLSDKDGNERSSRSDRISNAKKAR